MSPERKATAFWLAVGAAGFLLVPWYALEGSLFSTGWLRAYASKEAAPALLQGLRYDRIWLLPLGGLLLAGLALVSPRLDRAVRARGLLALGAAGFIYFLLQGFAIGPRGWSLATLGDALGPLAGGQYGMGLGAFLVAAAFAMLFALGLAQRGFFAGDGFIAACVLPTAVLISHMAQMHVIPANKDVESRLKKLRPGQVVTASGYLVDVRGPGGFAWNTSLSRTDTGDGACELFWVEALEAD